MFQTGLLVLTRPIPSLRMNVPSLLKEVEKIVCNTLYIHIQPTSTSPSHVSQSGTSPSSFKSPEVFQVANVPCSVEFRSLMKELYTASASICTHLDIRILLGHVTDKKSHYGILWDKHYDLKKSCDVVLFDDEKFLAVDDDLKKQRLGEYLAQAFKIKSPPDLNFFSGHCENNAVNQNISGSSDEMISTYENVVLGGTFDCLHVGHKMMLSEACLLCDGCLTVGVTERSMNKKKTLHELIQPIDERITPVVNFIEDVKPTIQHNVVPISDLFGPTITDPDLQCIVLSQETQKGGHIINDEREKKGMQKLDHYVIELVEDSCRNQYEENKVSSSSMRKRVLGTLINPVVNKHNLSTSPYVIGVTGSVCSGKSAICKRLENLGAAIVNCDLLGHSVYLKGMPAFDKLIEEFGKEIIGQDGEINRKVLGPLVFGDPNKLNVLNGIVWPEIRRLASEQILKYKSDGKKIIVIEAALLLEAGWDDLAHEVWTAIIPRDEAIKRMIERNNLSEADAAKRIDSQMTNEARLKKSNVVLCSLWEYEYTQQQVEKAWELLLQRCDS